MASQLSLHGHAVSFLLIREDIALIFSVHEVVEYLWQPLCWGHPVSHVKIDFIDPGMVLQIETMRPERESLK